jgi:DNA polymerase III subunit delta'
MSISEDDLLLMLETPLFGHAAQEAQLAEAVFRERLPSAYLFTGAKGIGKMSLALRLAATLLAGKADAENGMGLFGDALPALPATTLSWEKDAPAINRMVQRSHSDFLLLQPEYDAKKQTFKREIVISQTRAIGNFLSRTAGEGAWKIILIDPAEAMNNAATNSLLKWLEEPPPNSMFILISHRAEILLPTIRSRCRELAFAAPTRACFAQVLAMAEDDPVTRQLFRATGGSIGLAISWQKTQWREHLEGILQLCTLPPKQHVPAMTRLIDALMKDAGFGLVHVQRLMDGLLLDVMRLQHTGQMVMDTEEEVRAVQALATRHSTDVWFTRLEAQRVLCESSERLYLDKRTTLMTLFTALVG